MQGGEGSREQENSCWGLHPLHRPFPTLRWATPPALGNKDVKVHPSDGTAAGKRQKKENNQPATATRPHAAWTGPAEDALTNPRGKKKRTVKNHGTHGRHLDEK